MIRCKNCGAEMDEQEKFCRQCGTRREEMPAVDLKKPEPVDDRTTASADITGYSMKWHNFLMVVMIIGGVLTIINGFINVSGYEYTSQGLDAARVYSVYPGLKTADVAYGIAALCLGVFQFYVRNSLHAFRENAPRLLIILYVASIAAQLIYMAAASAAIHENLFNGSNLGSVIASGVMLLINGSYYYKRKALFIN